MTRVSIGLITVILVSCMSASAETLPIFWSETEPATILFQGKVGDTDAPRLFERMRTEPVEESSKIKKSVAYTHVSGATLFELLCSVSKRMENFGTCRLLVHRTEFSRIDKAQKLISLRVEDPEASQEIAALFADPESHGIVYYSNDAKFRIAVESREGTTRSFVMEYSGE